MEAIFIKYTLFMITAGLLTVCGTINAAETESHVDKIIAEMNKPDSNQVLVIAHRGDWRNHPENSISCVKSCIEMGVDIVELDVQKTKDGVFVLLHDGSVNRTTNGKGKISQMTFEEARKLRLKHRKKISNEQIPTLEEVLKVAKGKIMINVDKAGVSKELIDLIKKSGTLKQIVFKSGKSVESVNKSLAQSEHSGEICFMPVLRKGGLKDIIKYFEVSTKPKAAELIFNKAESQFNTEELVRELRAKGLRPWVNTLWASLCAGQNDAKAVKNPHEIWGGLIKKGYNMIQTDNPTELLKYLRSKDLHKFDDREQEKKSEESADKEAA